MAKRKKNSYEEYGEETFENTVEKIPDSYEEWLEEIGEEDSELLREWYELDDKDRAEWLRNHPNF